jgi:hypothetical protein
MEKATRFADAETTRWIEWGLQGYFRVLLGVAFVLLGAAIVVSRLVPSWLGVLLVLGGLLSLAIGFSIGYEGMESGFRSRAATASPYNLHGHRVATPCCTPLHVRQSPYPSAWCSTSSRAITSGIVATSATSPDQRSSCAVSTCTPVRSVRPQ